MRIEITDKPFWIDKCNKAIKNIQEERLKKQEYWEKQSWWYRLRKDEPNPAVDDFYKPKWNSCGEWEINDLKKKLEISNCGTILINPYEHDLNYVLKWAKDR